MRIERALVGLLFIASAAGGGCGKLAYNIPPASRIMEPGPGVGGPGPGVIPPAGSPYGMYGGGVNRFSGMGGPGGFGPGGAGMCGPMGPGAPNGGGFPQQGPPSDVMQASFNGPGGDGVVQTGFHHRARCLGPGQTEAFGDGGAGAAMATSQIAFLGDNGVQVSWDVSGAGMFDSSPLVIPGRQDFYQGAIYRLKLTNIPGRAGVQLYPTLEVAPVTPRTDAYLAHAPIPVQFTEEDFDQVVSGNFVTKVIYLPDPEFQELALAGVETLVSTRLDPGVDPIAEADRRGSILAIVRMGSKDLQLNGGVTSSQTEGIVPASHESATNSNWHAALRQQAPVVEQGAEEQAVNNEPANSEVADADVSPVQYCQGGSCSTGGYAGGGGACYGDGSMANMPMGMPTSGFAPPVVPPNMVAGGPQWGMPITGTPIGLPGPPHVPLGTPAGLQKHVMKNKTKVVLPPPVTKMAMTVKERPGQNYPRPVNHVHVDEVQREPVRLLPAWLTDAFHGGHGSGNGVSAAATVHRTHSDVENVACEPGSMTPATGVENWPGPQTLATGDSNSHEPSHDDGAETRAIATAIASRWHTADGSTGRLVVWPDGCGTRTSSPPAERREPATGSDWKPTTPARWTDIWVFPSGAHPGA